METLTITLKKTTNCWLAKFSDENPSVFRPTAFTQRVEAEYVIKRLSQIQQNKDASYEILN